MASRLLSDVVEGFGANLPLLVLPYVVDWIAPWDQSDRFLEVWPGFQFRLSWTCHDLACW